MYAILLGFTLRVRMKTIEGEQNLCRHFVSELRFKDSGNGSHFLCEARECLLMVHSLDHHFQRHVLHVRFDERLICSGRRERNERTRNLEYVGLKFVGLVQTAIASHECFTHPLPAVTTSRAASATVRSLAITFPRHLCLSHRLLDPHHHCFPGRLNACLRHKC